MTSVLTCHAIQTQLNKCSIVSVSNTLRAAATYYGLKTSLLSWRHSHLEIQEAPLLTCWEIMSTTNNRKMKKCKNNTLKWRVANVFPEMKVLPKRISPVNCHFVGNTLLSMETNSFPPNSSPRHSWVYQRYAGGSSYSLVGLVACFPCWDKFPKQGQVCQLK